MAQKYWLAENGTVRCLDDRCPQECDMGCPIYLQTLALPYLQNEHFEEAASYLEKAVNIEPKFAEAWNNLAACYGQLGKHQQAFECYSKSFDLLEKPNPLFGMAVAMKNMGKYTNAMQYVKMYERRYGLDDRINSVTAEISEKKMEEAVIRETAGNRPRTEEKTAATQKEAEDKTASDEESVVREYGKYFLMLIDEKTRESGYAEMEKLEPVFSEAGIALGQYYQGTDPQKAGNHYKAAADAGIAEGQWGYSQMMPHSYELDFSDTEDMEYLKYCLAAAEGGCPDAANEMGNICHRKGFYEESTYWYGMAYALEHPSGMAGLRGITKEWQQKGKSDEFNAHIDGFTEERYATALLLYKMFNQSMEPGDMDEFMRLALGGENLAGFIEAQIFEQQNHDDMAYRVYNALAFENHPYALRCLADMLLAGKGTKRDVESAFRMYKLSAEGGNATAMYAMGQKAMKDDDPYLAAGWFGMAYTRGFDMAGESLAQIAEKL